MRRFRKEFGLKKARILRERLIPVSQRLKIGINRHPLSDEHPSFLPEKVGQEESRPKKITKKGDYISRKIAGMLIFYELVE